MFVLLVLLFLSSCRNNGSIKLEGFSLISSKESGIVFSNIIIEDDSINYFTYPYIFMGGGVAVGDINSDGLTDIYLTSNMGQNKLYLNKGNMTFEDITYLSEVGGDDRWYTGTVMADVNGDGLLDIYVCASGNRKTSKNQLFLNQGDSTFLESAEKLGLADSGHSTQASFLDYDKDGDLDVYIANYPPLPFDAPYFQYSQNKTNPVLKTSDRLYRNNGNSFEDVTKQAGLLNYGLSLSATCADLNNDGWQDIYVSNDFASPDFVYLNQKDGTFLNVADKVMGHTSFYGMGTDIADITNNGMLDVFQVDMTPSDHYRSRTNMSSMDISGFFEMKNLGIQTQYMENSFQMNQGLNSNGYPLFSDVSRISNTALTDWSWSPLIFDMDNDGFNDIHVTNGTRKEINNKDFFKEIKKKRNNKEYDFLEDSKKIPSQAVSNVSFKQIGELSFEDKTQEWNMNQESFSNGSAYADFDNDGDLDLIINNIDQEAFLYQNNSSQNNWLRVALVGSAKNKFALGARVEIYINGAKRITELTSSRGFQSGSETKAHFGIGAAENVDSVIIYWPDDKKTVVNNPTINTVIEVSKINSSLYIKPIGAQKTLEHVSSKILEGVVHKENSVIDYQFELLLPHAMSMFGPALAIGDLNRDGLGDLFLGGAKDQEATILIQDSNRREFRILPNDDFKSNAASEDVDAHFFDADSDGDLDLYVACGGNEKPINDPFYEDKFYENVGGELVYNPLVFPKITSSASKVKSTDIDNDGDLDLLVSSRHVPHQYGKPATSHLLLNESSIDQIKFTEVTKERAKDLQNIGMVTDFTWVDYDLDDDMDVVLVGEWMPVVFLNNHKGFFTKDDKLSNTTVGWWSSINYADINSDNAPDFIVGNLGQNYKYQVNENAEFGFHVGDFDQNGKRDIVLSYTQEDEVLPVRGKQCSAEQMPKINEKFESYHEFANANLIEIYGRKALDTASISNKISTFASQVYLSNPSGVYTIKDLPKQAQLSSLNSSIIEDFNGDGHVDVLLAGNLFASEAETKRNDASYGLLLKGNSLGDFEPVPLGESGFIAQGDVKTIKKIKYNGKDHVIVVRNNDYPLLFNINNSKNFNDEIF